MSEPTNPDNVGRNLRHFPVGRPRILSEETECGVVFVPQCSVGEGPDSQKHSTNPAHRPAKIIVKSWLPLNVNRWLSALGHKNQMVFKT